MPQQTPGTKTLIVTNFSGRLSRILNGDVNSGFAKFTSSFGYDPFSKPMNLTWLETPADITGPIANMPLASTNYGTYIVDQGGKLYTMLSSSTANPNIDSVVGIASMLSSNNYLFGASIEQFGQNKKLFVGNDVRVESINPDGTAATIVGSQQNYVPNTRRPLRKFAGGLFFGNGPSIGKIDTTNTVTSSVFTVSSAIGVQYSQLNPALPSDYYVQDVDVNPTGEYLLITAANQVPERIDAQSFDTVDAIPADSGIFKWNGVDQGITATTLYPSTYIQALHTFLDKNFIFGTDTFGAAVTNNLDKLLTLPNNKPPLPNSTAANGNFITFLTPEVVGNARYASLYYFGALDQENPVGLYRMLRYATTQSNGFIFQTPLNVLVNTFYKSINTAGTAISTLGYGKHYLGIASTNNSGNQYKLLRFLVTPTGSGTPQAGVYETQTQLFSKRIGIAQIRVYTEPTVTGNAFQIDLVGSDGNVMDNCTFNYTYGSVLDPVSNSYSVERINFNPGSKTTFALGIRVTNTGTTNMTIKKIEIDYSEEGK